MDHYRSIGTVGVPPLTYDQENEGASSGKNTKNNMEKDH
jgi:hypothetical protein